MIKNHFKEHLLSLYKYCSMLKSRLIQMCKGMWMLLRSSLTKFIFAASTVIRTRNLRVNILGRPSRSGLTLAAMFSYESQDAQGRTLNLGETVILSEEIPKFMSILRQHGIIVTALHNHWLYEQPRLMYIHFESVGLPLDSVLEQIK